jgi:hypothetical protein
MEQPVFVDLPPGWIPRTSRSPSVRQVAGYPELKAHFTLAFQPRSQFKNDLLLFARETKRATAEQTKLANRTETELSNHKIGSVSVMSYEINGQSGGYVARSRIVLFEAGNWFCKLYFWVPPENWDAAQAKFDELVGRIRVRSGPNGE